MSAKSIASIGIGFGAIAIAAVGLISQDIISPAKSSFTAPKHKPAIRRAVESAIYADDALLFTPWGESGNGAGANSIPSSNLASDIKGGFSLKPVHQNVADTFNLLLDEARQSIEKAIDQQAIEEEKQRNRQEQIKLQEQELAIVMLMMA